MRTLTSSMRTLTSNMRTLTSSMRTLTSSMRTLTTYLQTHHPKLGSALKSLGNVYLNKYRTHPDFRVANDTGPAHGPDGDAALVSMRTVGIYAACIACHTMRSSDNRPLQHTWVRAARTFERLGLTELESDYSWSCFDIGKSISLRIPRIA
jgi:hypothetical protein